MPESLFSKVAGLRAATLLKKGLWYRCFPVNFAKFLRTPFLIEHLWWLLLQGFMFVNKSLRLLGGWTWFANYLFFSLSNKNTIEWLLWLSSEPRDFFNIPADIYLLKVDNMNTRKRCKICSKLTIKTLEWRKASFKHILHLALVLILNFKNVKAGWVYVYLSDIFTSKKSFRPWSSVFVDASNDFFALVF